MSEPEHEGHIAVALAELSSKIQTLLDKQEELAENISQIKEAVYNPDEGLYARLKELDRRLLSLEAWKKNNAKVLWIVVTVGIGLLASTFFQVIF